MAEDYGKVNPPPDGPPPPPTPPIHPGLAELTQEQIEYLIATIHSRKPELDALFAKTTPIDLLIIITYLSAVFLTGAPGLQDLMEQLINLFMNLYPAYQRADWEENKGNIPPGFRVIIPVMPERKPEHEFMSDIFLDKAPTTGSIN